MHKKHVILPIFLLISCSTQSFFSDRWMTDMMREMEESFGRMHQMMEEAFEHSDSNTSKSKSSVKHRMQQNDTHVQFIIEQVAQHDINAQFDDNVLNVKHPDFVLKITQLKNRYNQPLLSVEMRSEHTQHSEAHEKEISQDGDAENRPSPGTTGHAPSYYSSSIHSSMETTSISKPVELDNPEISYDEDTQTLTIILPHKSGKKIPVMVKRSAEKATR